MWRCCHIIESIEWTEAGRRRVRCVVRHVHAVQYIIQWEIGVAGFATGGHSEHTRRQHVVLLFTLYVLNEAQSTTQLALFVGVKVTVLHKTIWFEILLVCESRANQAVAQTCPIDALHLISL